MKNVSSTLRPHWRRLLAIMVIAAAGLPAASIPLAAQTELPAPEIARRIAPSVVRIIALANGREVSQGSGFVVRENGTIITNRHVVENATDVHIELENGDIYDRVYVVNVDKHRDLLVLKVPAVGLTPVTLGDDRGVVVGDPIYTMGHPKGMGTTFSDGIVSGTPSMDGVDILQITAPISPGSSGGPVVDNKGDVVGVATAYLQDAQNLNLAVRSRYVEGLLSADGELQPFPDVASRFSSAQGVAPASAGAGGEAEEWVQVLLHEVEFVNDAVRGEGLKRVSEVTYGIMAPAERREFEIKVGGDATFVAVVGVCDVDCSDLDLALYNEAGHLLTADEETDDRPMVGGMVGPGRSIKVTVLMADCSTETCGIALQVFAKPANAR